MTGPSSAPRGERAGTPGARWETRLVWSGEEVVDDDAEPPRPNRATRRAVKRQGRSKPQHAPGKPSAPVSGPEGLETQTPSTPHPSGRQNATEGIQQCE